MIIGLTGTNASGKSTVAKYLVKKGFDYYSLSDELRLLLKKRKIAATRENLIAAGKDCRTQYGRGYLAEVVLKKIKNKNKIVVDSIRNLGEVSELRKTKGFFLLAVDAPVKIRFQRAKKRMSKRDQKTLAEFIANERKELYGKGAEQQIVACMKQADVTLDTQHGYTKLYKKIDALLKHMRDHK